MEVSREGIITSIFVYVSKRDLLLLLLLLINIYITIIFKGRFS